MKDDGPVRLKNDEVNAASTSLRQEAPTRCRYRRWRLRLDPPEILSSRSFDRHSQT
jgi:hypothetical protein